MSLIVPESVAIEKVVVSFLRIIANAFLVVRHVVLRNERHIEELQKKQRAEELAAIQKEHRQARYNMRMARKYWMLKRELRQTQLLAYVAVAVALASLLFSVHAR